MCVDCMLCGVIVFNDYVYICLYNPTLISLWLYAGDEDLVYSFGQTLVCAR